MNVAMIAHAYYLKDARVRRYAEALTRQGHCVDVYCLREGNEALVEKKSGVLIFRINVTRKRGGKLAYLSEYAKAIILFFIRINVAALAGRRYDMVHIHNFPNLLVFSAMVQKRQGAKLILDVHDPMPELFRSKFKVAGESPFIRILEYEEKISFKFADHIITAAHSFKDILIRRGCPPDRISVIVNSPDNIFWRSLPAVKKDHFEVLYIGTIAERYGLNTLLDAAAILNRRGTIPNLKIKIIPKILEEGDYLCTFMKNVHRKGLSDLVEMAEPVSHDQMPRVIAACDLSVYTPMPDVHMDIALSLKIPEVIAVGRPLVASRLSVLLRYFGEDALHLFDPGDAEQCAGRITDVYLDPQGAEEKAGRARAALRAIGWDLQREIYFDLIKSLVA
jgi:glycosyltransferase involved in cell wall biosynthesis